MEISINQSVAILCDGNNIERSIQEQHSPNAMLNFDNIIPRLLNGRGLNRLIYFREGKQISSKLAERLYVNYYGSVVPCHKSADIPLSIKATQLASKVDTIIIMSGDSDFVELVRHLKAEGVRIEIAAVPETTAKILIDEVDHFHPIVKADWFIYSGARPRRGPSRDSKAQKRDELAAKKQGNKNGSSKPGNKKWQPKVDKQAPPKVNKSAPVAEESKGFLSSLKKLVGKE